MASCITSQWGDSYSPRLQLTVTQQSSTNTQVVLAWTLQYVATSAAVSSVAKTYSAVVAGETVASGSYSIGGKKGTYTIASGTKNITKSTSSQTITFSCSMSFNLTWNGVYGGTKSASGSITIAAKTSYTISYNANGGTGAPSSQTKWYGTALTLSNTKPTRTGYTFKCWNTTFSSGTVSFNPGGSYTTESNATLYAVWEPLTYSVKYNANGGTGAPSSQTKTYGVSLTLSSTKPTRTNYTFKGWGTSSGATTVAYAAGASYTKNAAITLYAIWELAYTKPRITGIVAERYNANTETIDDYGTYARIIFDWETDKEISYYKIEWQLDDAGDEWETVGEFTPGDGGTSGSVQIVVGAGNFNPEYSYNIRITVADSSGYNAITVVLSSIKLAFDAMQETKGVAFGKPATKEGYAEFEYAILANKGILDASGLSIRNGLAFYESSGSTDANTTTEEMFLSAKNTPDSSLWFVRQMFYNTKSSTANRVQLAVPYEYSTSFVNSKKSNYIRHYLNGTGWTDWIEEPVLVESGTSGIWTYEKWSTGQAYVRGAVTIANLNMSTAMGSLYRSAQPYTRDDYPYPLTFVDVPFFTASFMPSNGIGGFVWIAGNADTTTNMPPLMYLVRQSSATGANGLLYMKAEGKWK